jgi:hypothetical protein
VPGVTAPLIRPRVPTLAMMVTAIRVSEASYGAGEGGQVGRSRARTARPGGKSPCIPWPSKRRGLRRCPVVATARSRTAEPSADITRKNPQSPSKSLEQKLGHGIMGVVRVCARRTVGAGMATTAVVGSVRTINFFLLVPPARYV